MHALIRESARAARIAQQYHLQQARSQTRAYRDAERARKAGVAVSYEPSEDMIHVWHLFASMLDEGRNAIDRIGEFVRKHAA